MKLKKKLCIYFGLVLAHFLCFVYICVICKNVQLASDHAAVKYILQKSKLRSIKCISNVYNVKYCTSKFYFAINRSQGKLYKS